jgi:hypothetical protein
VKIRTVVIGVALLVLGLLMAVFPQPLVAVANRYRIWMPDRPTAQSLRGARLGALLVVVLGVLVIAFA